jgi:hypothetical protein
MTTMDGRVVEADRDDARPPTVLTALTRPRALLPEIKKGAEQSACANVRMIARSPTKQQCGNRHATWASSVAKQHGNRCAICASSVAAMAAASRSPNMRFYKYMPINY